MTELEQAQFALALFNALNPLMIASFLLGLLAGAFFFGRIAHSIDRICSRLPRRIKIKSDIGVDQYLYLFKGRYYKKSDCDELIKTSRKYIVVNPDYQNK